MEKRHCIFSIFGATGDLAKRKLLPALYYLEKENLLGHNFKIIAISRKAKTSDEYRREASDSIRDFSKRKVDNDVLDRLVSRIHYAQLEISNLDSYIGLRKFICEISGKKCDRCERIFYLAVPSFFFAAIVDNLKKSGLAEKEQSGKAYNRVMFEKPFGYNLESAKELNVSISKVFHEKQIYRIDHYVAKELVQNLLVLRFANSIFEPLWSNKYIDHVQITVAESLGMEGRGEYYDKAGAIRDVMQNHMMQLLTLVAMEAPKSFSAYDLREEKVKVLQSIAKFLKNKARKIAVIGQYTEGEIDSKPVSAYIKEPEISEGSKTETFAALKLSIRNKIWKGVPFYLRTGKRLKERATEIVIAYNSSSYKLFRESSSGKNMLIVRVQPYDGITLQFNAKVPGNKLIIDDVTMDFCHECKFGPNSPEAYERLLYDVMIGDQTLFTGWGEIENSWGIFDILLDGLKSVKPFDYNAGTWGPAEADKFIEKDGRKWVEPKKPAYAELLGK